MDIKIIKQDETIMSQISSLLQLACLETSSWHQFVHDRIFDRHLIKLVFEYLFSPNYAFSVHDDNYSFSPSAAVLNVESQRLCVLDKMHDQVLMFSADGKKLLGQFGSDGDEKLQFYQPYALAVQDCHLYISDNGNARIQVVAFDSKNTCSGVRFVREFGHGILKSPHGIAIDSSTNRVFVADHEHRIAIRRRLGRKFRTDGGSGARAILDDDLLA